MHAWIVRMYNLFPSLILFVLFAPLALSTGPASAQSEKTWESLRENVFPNREINDGGEFLAIEAPIRAEDAAIVPVAVALKKEASPPAPIKAITLIVDENPSPVVATFSYGPASADPAMETRVRVNDYSYVRAVAELADGRLYMVKRFVKASGGCSAPALKDADQAKAEIGKMRMKTLLADGHPPRAQLMIRHPNYSGLQMNQLTMLYIPAHFIREIEVRQSGELLWRMEGGISISENPNFIFAFNQKLPNAKTFSVRAVDTEDKVFEQNFTLEEAKG